MGVKRKDECVCGGGERERCWRGRWVRRGNKAEHEDEGEDAQAGNSNAGREIPGRELSTQTKLIGLLGTLSVSFRGGGQVKVWPHCGRKVKGAKRKEEWVGWGKKDAGEKDDG